MRSAPLGHAVQETFINMVTETPQIFIATAANADAQTHYRNSVIRPLNDEVVALIPPALAESARAANGAYYAWGAMPGVRNDVTYQALEVGDYVIFVYGKRYRSWAQVTSKFESAEFARALWGSENGTTWQHAYFLTEPVTTDVPLAALEKYMQRLYLGFTRISSANIERIVGDFGSVTNFIASSFNLASYLIIRSNESSDWRDEDGKGYEYGTNVPNYKRILPGSRVLIERKVGRDRLVLGHAAIGAIEHRDVRNGQQILYARFHDYKAYVTPLAYPGTSHARIEALSNFNVQHAITYITGELYLTILNELDQAERVELVKEEIADNVGGFEPATRRGISGSPPRNLQAGRHSSDPNVRRQMLDRRNKAHHALVLALKELSEGNGSQCDCSQYADILIESKNFNAIVEVKSIRDDLLKQVRVGVGQLFMYRFLHFNFDGFGMDDDVRLYLLLDEVPDAELTSFLRRARVGMIWFKNGHFGADDETLVEMPWLRSAVAAAA